MIKVDLKESLKVLSDLFKDMKLPPLLERRVIESFLYANETVSTTNHFILAHKVGKQCIELLRTELFLAYHGDLDNASARLRTAHWLHL